MSGWGWFFLILLLLVLAYAGFAGYRFWHARRTGQPLTLLQALNPLTLRNRSTSSPTNYPAPRSLGPLEWFKDRFDSLRNKRSTTSGGYEESRGLSGGGNDGGYDRVNSGGLGAAGRGRGREDDAWDARVPSTRDDDPYGYHEEAELGLAPTPGQGTGYVGAHTRSDSDYLNAGTGYSGGDQRGRSPNRDPFGDEHAAPASLRSVSPRPADGLGHTRGQSSLGTDDGNGNSSPVSTRKSAFREGI